MKNGAIPAPDIWAGFEVRDLENAQATLACIGGVGLSHATFDLDGTLIDHEHSIYHIVRNERGYLLEENRRRAEHIRDRYLPDMREGRLSTSRSRRFTKLTLAQFEGADLTALNKRFADIPMRDGAVDLIRHLQSYNVHIRIVSAGIAPAIRSLFRAKGLVEPEVVANELVSDGGTVTGWRRDKFVYDLNKNRWAQRVEQAHAETGGQLLIGDQVSDSKMARERDGHILRIVSRSGMTPQKPEWNEFRDQCFAQVADHAPFDAIVTEDGLQPVISLARYLASR